MSLSESIALRLSTLEMNNPPKHCRCWSLPHWVHRFMRFGRFNLKNFWTGIRSRIRKPTDGLL